MVSTYGYTTAAKVKARLENYDTSADDTQIDVYITHAEGLIIALTRFTFKTTIPEIVESLATDLAAVYLLIFNPAGFSSASEAALLADLLWGTIERSIKILSDDRTLSFLKGA